MTSTGEALAGLSCHFLKCLLRENCTHTSLTSTIFLPRYFEEIIAIAKPIKWLNIHHKKYQRSECVYLELGTNMVYGLQWISELSMTTDLTWNLVAPPASCLLLLLRSFPWSDARQSQTRQTVTVHKRRRHIQLFSNSGLNCCCRWPKHHTWWHLLGWAAERHYRAEAPRVKSDSFSVLPLARGRTSTVASAAASETSAPSSGSVRRCMRWCRCHALETIRKQWQTVIIAFRGGLLCLAHFAIFSD